MNAYEKQMANIGFSRKQLRFRITLCAVEQYKFSMVSDRMNNILIVIHIQMNMKCKGS